jgi:uncharacterized protein YjbI with pentapeptide repeats
MANGKHRSMMRKGLRAWNQWRKDNPEIRPDLSGAYIGEVCLIEANLSDVNLCEVGFNRANLSKANLNKANLSQAILSKANLSGANLSKANLSEANLSEANLSEANLSEANLSEANLSRASLSETNLTGANLSKTNFSDLDFSKTILKKAILSGLDFRGRDFSKKDLSGVRFQNTNLQRCCLINTNLDGADLTEALLWETQRAGWSIKGVICESVYWDKEAKEKTLYAPGEFERLFADQTKIRLFYKDGITALEIATLPALIQHLANSYPESNLRFVSIYEDSGGATVELAIEAYPEGSPEELKQLQAALQVEAQQKVEYQRQALTERETRLQLEGEVKRLDSFVDKLLLKQGNTYINNGQVGAMGDYAEAHDSTLNQIVNAENSSVGTQIQGESNVAVDGESSDVISGDDKAETS